jgi:hypothetical protein
MTYTEISTEFDIIYENISKGGAPGLIPYEKSVILTQAAEKVAESLIVTDRSLISNLISVYSVAPLALPIADSKINPNSYLFALPAISNSSILRILLESVSSASEEFKVIPISDEEYNIAMSKPYRYPRRRTAWRLVNSQTTTGYVEIVGRSGVVLTKYKSTIVKYPSPIIVDDITPLTLRGLSAPQMSDLIPSLHPKILEVATVLAEKYYLDKYNTNDGS